MIPPVMKTLLLFLATGLAAHAQSYSIPWAKIAGGGGDSTGGVFTVRGTIGQHDAGGPLTNGIYSVVGGFWVLPSAIQITGAPILTIAPGTPGQAIISWHPASPGYILQDSTHLNPNDWANAPSGITNPVTVPAGPNAKFYRLHKP
jgi:hypothetical protein